MKIKTIEGKDYLRIHDKQTPYTLIGNISYFMADGGYTHIFFNKNKEVVERVLLKKCENLLSNFGFIRINHNILVNTKHITGFVVGTKEKKCFIREIELNFSRRRFDFLMEAGMLPPLMTKTNHL